MPDTAAQILHNARWLAGLSQAQVAQRAGVTQQMVAQYERGHREPSFSRLAALVAGCGVELTTHLVPRPGLEDAPTQLLLEQAPFDRLPEQVRLALLRWHTAATSAYEYDVDVPHPPVPYLLGGKAAARLHGAFVQAHELELWFPGDVDLSRLATALDQAGTDNGVGLTGPRVVPEPERILLLEGWHVGGLSAPLHLRSVDDFPQLHSRGVDVDLPGLDLPARVVDPHDCVIWWHGRDLDHLALQRALRLSKEATSNPV